MKRAFPWLLSNFAGGFLLVLAVQIAVLGLGLRVALAGYAGFQRAELETIARNILLSPDAEHDQTLQYSNSFFVFSPDGELLFSNRGRGRAIPREDLNPVTHAGAVIGYYYAGQMKFVDNEANRVFLTTLLLLTGASVIGSLTVGFLVSVLASRRIAGAVTLLQTDIQSIESRSPIRARTFAIAELTGISRSLEKLSAILANEEDYKRQWMQDIAHDLRTPIGGLRGQIEGMRDGVLEPTTERFERNLLEIDRLQGLVQGISELYAVERVDKLEIREFSAVQFVEEVLTPHEMVRRRKEITVRVSIGIQTLAGDRRLLLRAVGNVVSNAFAYGKAGGTIAMAVRAEGQGVGLEVADDGPGIPPDQLDKVFHRFFRGEYARHSAGTGLGLSIARAIVERHGGTISVTNRRPTGAAFLVWLPVRR